MWPWVILAGGLFALHHRDTARQTAATASQDALTRTLDRAAWQREERLRFPDDTATKQPSRRRTFL